MEISDKIDFEEKRAIITSENPELVEYGEEIIKDVFRYRTLLKGQKNKGVINGILESIQDKDLPEDCKEYLIWVGMAQIGKFSKGTIQQKQIIFENFYGDSGLYDYP